MKLIVWSLFIVGVNLKCVEVLLYHKVETTARDNLHRTAQDILNDISKKADKKRTTQIQQIAQMLA